MPLLDVTQFDRDYYERHVDPFIPEKIIDIHTHVYQRIRVDLQVW